MQQAFLLDNIVLFKRALKLQRNVIHVENESSLEKYSLNVKIVK